MQPEIDYTKQYNTNEYNAATKGVASPQVHATSSLGRDDNTDGIIGVGSECFICGRHQSKTITLRLIRRWKTASRKVILIFDSVCSICDDKHKLISSNPNKHAKHNNNR